MTHLILMAIFLVLDHFGGERISCLLLVAVDRLVVNMVNLSENKLEV